MNKFKNLRKKRHLFQISFIFQLPFYMHIFTTANSKHNKASLKGNWDKCKLICELEKTYYKISWMKTKFFIKGFFFLCRSRDSKQFLYGCPKMAPWNVYLTIMCASLLFWSASSKNERIKCTRTYFEVRNESNLLLFQFLKVSRYGTKRIDTRIGKVCITMHRCMDISSQP